MTVKELAEFFGKSDDTIIKHSKKCGIIFHHGKETVFNKSEVELLSRSLYKNIPKAVKDAIDITFLTPAKQVSELTENSGVDTNTAFINALNTITKINENLLKRMDAMEQKQPQQQALPPITINPRAKLRELINNYVTITGNTHGQAWGKFYQACYYHLKINLTVRSENSGMDKLDILESEGLMDKALNLAYEIFK